MDEKKRKKNLLDFFKKKSKQDEELFESQASSSQDQGLELEQPSLPSTSSQNTNIQELADLNDIGFIVHCSMQGSQKLTDDKKLSLIQNAWTPGPNYSFPSSGKRNLKFQYLWLNRWKWLAYSKYLDGAFCKHCVLFSASGAGRGSQPLGKLVARKYDSWKDAVEDFDKHEQATYHKACTVKSANFLSISENKQDSVDLQMDEGLKNLIKNNRLRLTPIIETIIFCGRQGISLRGHRDSGTLAELEEPVENDGNFRALLRFKAKSGDKELIKHLKTASQNATYISPRIQNEIISACNTVILREIVKKINSSDVFCVLADETTDVSGIQQLSLSARFLSKVDGKTRVNEEFLQFIPLNDATGYGLATTILENLRDLGLDLQKLRGQGYDGASVMSGKFNGVQAHIKQKLPLALYVHCSSHSLNLAVSEACNVTAIRNAMGTLGACINFFHASAKRQKSLSNSIETLLPSNSHDRLKKLCPTRWSDRHDSVLLFIELLPAVLDSLEELSINSEKETAVSANQFLSSIRQSEFLISVYCLQQIFSVTFPLSRFLQTENLDLTEAVNYAENCKNVLQEFRNNADAEFHNIFDSVLKVCEDQDIDIKIPRLVGRQTNRCNIPAATPEEYFRAAIYIPFLDSFLQQLGERFLEHKNLLSSFKCLLPGKNNLRITAEREKEARMLYSVYGETLECNEEALIGELRLWYCHLASLDLNPKNALSALDACDMNFFPTINSLLQTLSVLPVSIATSERTFSTLKLLKSYLRNTMSEMRLNGLSLLYIHRGTNITPENVIDELARKPRRLDIRL